MRQSPASLLTYRIKKKNFFSLVSITSIIFFFFFAVIYPSVNDYTIMIHSLLCLVLTFRGWNNKQEVGTHGRKSIKWGSLLSDFGVILPKTPRKMKVLTLFQENFIK